MSCHPTFFLSILINIWILNVHHTICLALPNQVDVSYMFCPIIIHFFGNDKEITILKNKIMQAFILKHFHLENTQYNRAQNVLNCSPINFLYRRSVLIVFFNVITPLYRPASWCVLILLFIGMVSKKKKKCILVLAATAAISFLWFLFLLTLLLVVLWYTISYEY